MRAAILSTEEDSVERRPLLHATSPPALLARSRRRRNWACAAILITEFFERVAFYSLTANFILYLTRVPLHWNSYNAASFSLFATGLAYFRYLFQSTP